MIENRISPDPDRTWGASCTQREVSMVFLGRISPNSFCLYAAVGGIVDVVVFSFIFKLSFVLIDSFLVLEFAMVLVVLLVLSYGMIHEDGDNDAISGNDDERAIRKGSLLLSGISCCGGDINLIYTTIALNDLTTISTIVDNEFKGTANSCSSYKFSELAFMSITSAVLNENFEEEFQQPEFEGYGPKISKSVSEDVSNEVRKSPDAPLVEELVSDVDKFEKNMNNQKYQQLGSNFVKYNKACFVYGSFDHLQTNCNYHQREMVVSGSNYTRVNYNYSAQKTHPSAQRNMVPRAVLMKNSLITLNTARPVNIAHPKKTVYSARPMSHFYTRRTLTNKNLSQKVNTAKGNFYTAKPKTVNTARPNTAVVNTVRANQGHPQQEDQGYVDSGCSRHMTGNMSYLSNFKEFDGGYVTFGRGAKGGRITGKGTLKTSKLDFEDVYFVKEL
ncbi:hypothetical protein Tco_0759448 [Tanacetum coccineum]